MNIEKIEMGKAKDIKQPYNNLTYSIQLTCDNLLKTCAICSSMETVQSIPYEIVDKNGLPICHVCAKKHVEELFVLLYHYKSKLQTFSGFIDTERERCKYIFKYGFDESFTDKEEMNRIVNEISKIMRKFGVLVTYYTNITGNNHSIVLGMAENSISDVRTQKAVREIIIEGKSTESSMKYLLMYDKIIKTTD